MGTAAYSVGIPAGKIQKGNMTDLSYLDSLLLYNFKAAAVSSREYFV